MTQILPASCTTVLVVDDEPSIRRIVRLLLKKERCDVLEASNTREAEELLRSSQPDVMLLDIGLPGESGLSFLERIGNSLGQTLVVMSTGVDDAQVAVSAMRLGARDYIVKPYSHGTFLSSLKNVIEKRDLQRQNAAYQQGLEDTVAERTQELKQVQDATVFAIAKIAQSRDDETGTHLERMRDYSIALARYMQRRGCEQCTDDFIQDLFRAAPLHDVGKVGIPDSILLKPDRLTATEFDLMKTHSSIGAQCLLGAARLAQSRVGSFLRMGQAVARHHHESWDGQGYPDQLQGEDIPLAARIVSLADFYDALAFPRVYRPTAFSHEQIRQMIVELSGKKFDPEIVAVFLAVEDEFLQIRVNRTDESTCDDIDPS